MEMFHGFDQVKKAIIIIHQIPDSQGFVGSGNPWGGGALPYWVISGMCSQNG